MNLEQKLELERCSVPRRKNIQRAGATFVKSAHGSNHHPTSANGSPHQLPSSKDHCKVGDDGNNDLLVGAQRRSARDPVGQLIRRFQGCRYDRVEESVNWAGLVKDVEKVKHDGDGQVERQGRKR